MASIVVAPVTAVEHWSGYYYYEVLRYRIATNGTDRSRLLLCLNPKLRAPIQVSETVAGGYFGVLIRAQRTARMAVTHL